MSSPYDWSSASQQGSRPAPIAPSGSYGYGPSSSFPYYPQNAAPFPAQNGTMTQQGFQYGSGAYDPSMGSSSFASPPAPSYLPALALPSSNRNVMAPGTSGYRSNAASDSYSNGYSKSAYGSATPGGGLGHTPKLFAADKSSHGSTNLVSKYDSPAKDTFKSMPPPAESIVDAVERCDVFSTPTQQKPLRPVPVTPSSGSTALALFGAGTGTYHEPETSSQGALSQAARTPRLTISGPSGDSTPGPSAVLPLGIVPSSIQPPPSRVRERPEERKWVTVFGFAADQYMAALQHLQSCGEILRHQPGKHPSNWIHIMFTDEMGAESALHKNGDVIGGSTMIGVVPGIVPFSEGVLAGAPQDTTSPPKKIFKSSKEYEVEMDGAFAAPKPSSSWWSKVVEYTLGT